MAVSGVTVDSSVSECYGQIALSGGKVKAALFKITDDCKKITLVEDSLVPKCDSNPFQQILEQLPDKDVRYGVVEVCYKENASESTTKNKLALMMWVPEGASVKKKMLASTSFQGLKKEFSSVTLFVEMTEKTIDALGSKLVTLTKQLEEIEGRPVKVVGGEWVFDD